MRYPISGLLPCVPELARGLEQVIGHHIRIDLKAALRNGQSDFGYTRSIYHRHIGHVALDGLQLRGNGTQLHTGTATRARA